MSSFSRTVTCCSSEPSTRPGSRVSEGGRSRCWRRRAREPDCPADFEFETLPDGSRRLRQVLCAADYHPDIWDFVSSAPMTSLAADVVGPNVQFRESGISFKFPGGRGFDWHQDIVFFPSSNRSPIMTLTFVEDVDADMGPTRVIPGSHLGEVYDHYDADGKLARPHRRAREVPGCRWRSRWQSPVPPVRS